jgi:signal transduction histidine kinase
MSLEVMRRECKSAGLDLERALTRADRGLRRCETIITELLDFARAKGLRRRPTVLNAWLAGVLDEHDIPETVHIVRELQDNGIEAQVDREELRRAVINVVDNACQAMAQGRTGDGQGAARELTVTVQAFESRTELGFADNGPGIPDDILPQVMEPLFSTKPFGTGLGLPTVKRIMEQHNGGVEVDSALGIGTRVVLWLPAEDSGGRDVER